ncbi:MAG TPA: hypothetical protein VNE58_18415 [Casimicrobiaceae bacterium]|nr:hypothetical protein [Casimicrobiaceae bacterium]
MRPTTFGSFCYADLRATVVEAGGETDRPGNPPILALPGIIVDLSGTL